MPLQLLAGSADGYTSAIDMYSFSIMMCEIVMTYMKHISVAGETYKADNDHARLLADTSARLAIMCPSLGVVLAACGDRDPSRRMTALSALSILKDAAVVLNPPPVVPVDQVRTSALGKGVVCVALFG